MPASSYPPEKVIELLSEVRTAERRVLDVVTPGTALAGVLIKHGRASNLTMKGIRRPWPGAGR